MNTKRFVSAFELVLSCFTIGSLAGGCVTYVDDNYRRPYNQGYYDKYGHWNAYDYYRPYYYQPNYYRPYYPYHHRDWDHDREHHRGDWDNDHDYRHH